jgi:hypothetical protein
VSRQRTDRRRASTVAALVVSTLVASGVGAEVYKCAGEGNRPIYQEMPCPAGKELRNFQVDPPEITIVPGTSRAREAAPPPGTKAVKEQNANKDARARVDKPGRNPSERRHLHSGMSEGEVLARVGRPDVTSAPKGGKQVRWTWLPTDGDPETVTTLTIVAGIVTQVDRTLVKR